MQAPEAAVANAKQERRKRERAATVESTESILPTESPTAERVAAQHKKFRSRL
jgi:hypothetical protein